MPGWHAKTRELVQTGKLTTVGIAPEQHGDRMALFLQWKGMTEMPVMLDSYNQFGLSAVPITLLIDEAGVVRHHNPGEGDLKKFMSTPPVEAGPARESPRARPRDWIAGADLAKKIGTVQARSPEEDFAYGVAHRKICDQQGLRADPEHFRRAIFYWRRALQRNPSNYIWRRRLQQYGPRLDKPYPFYDWVEAARADLRQRGLPPHPLEAEPTGAEIARPLRELVTDGEEPDPDQLRRVPRDEAPLVRCETFIVPHTTKPASAVRVFMSLTPNARHKAKWNDEAGGSTIQLLPPDGWKATKSLLHVPPSPAEGGPGDATARRQVEFELHRVADAAPRQAQQFTFLISYNVCHGENQVCQFFHNEITVDYALPPLNAGHDARP